MASEPKKQHRIGALKIQIEDGIPIPSRVSLAPGLSKLEVGNSFSVPDVYWVSLRNAASNMSKRTGKKFTVRKIKVRNNDGSPKLNDRGKQVIEARVWRIS
jgi:hypothetical protein